MLVMWKQRHWDAFGEHLEIALPGNQVKNIETIQQYSATKYSIHTTKKFSNT